MVDNRLGRKYRPSNVSPSDSWCRLTARCIEARAHDTTSFLAFRCSWRLLSLYFLSWVRWCEIEYAWSWLKNCYNAAGNLRLNAVNAYVVGRKYPLDVANGKLLKIDWSLKILFLNTAHWVTLVHCCKEWQMAEGEMCKIACMNMFAIIILLPATACLSN